MRLVAVFFWPAQWLLCPVPDSLQGLPALVRCSPPPGAKTATYFLSIRRKRKHHVAVRQLCKEIPQALAG